MAPRADRPGSLTERPIPDALRRDVRLLTTLLGDAVREEGGEHLFGTVEELRTACIALRRRPSAARRTRVEGLVAALDHRTAERVSRAFTAYFQLVNLAEEQQRIRSLRAAGRAGRTAKDSVEAAVAGLGPAAAAEIVERMRIHPVLTAHPTEAKRRAVVETLWRIAALLERLGDERGSPAEQTRIRRRLAEEIAGLWLTAPIRRHPPTPLDEVRASLALFDHTIFRIVPHVYREVERCLEPARAGTGPSVVPAFLRWGTWVGADRDGNGSVTAQVTRRAAAIQADHALRGLENAARRIARSLTLSEDDVPASRRLLSRLRENERLVPRRGAELQRTVPDAPHRRALVLVAERLAATRASRDAGYDGPEPFLRDLREIRASLATGAPRLAFGELQQLIWQGETFGFHLAEMEIRQHADVHASALRELVPTIADDASGLDRLGRALRPPDLDRVSRSTAEALDTFRAMAEIQRRFGVPACHRVIVSFTRSAADLAGVHALARLCGPDVPVVDAVPLFESAPEIRTATTILDETMALPGVRRRVRARGGRIEVMLGYSDSSKEVGMLSANLLLYRAQAELAAWGRRRGLELTIFHGRGGALGRGGGPTNLAILGQPPGSVDGRFKVTEQGEAAFQRYGNIAIAIRHLEQVVHAVLLAPTAVEPDPAEPFGRQIDLMERASTDVYRSLIDDPRFPELFRTVTPIRDIGALPIASRPVARAPGGQLEAVRAIPWVFAWAQSRVNLPGWYGLGSGLEAVAGQRGGLAMLRRMRLRWPFFASLLDNAELSLAKADPGIAERYLARSAHADLRRTIVEEFERTRRLVLAIGGHERLLEGRPGLRAAVELRDPYVDALSFLQLRFMDERGTEAERIVQATINGVAAGLQNTG